MHALRLLDCLQADLATGTLRLSSPVIEKFKAFWQAVLSVFGFGSSNSELIGDEWQYIYTTKPDDGFETVCNRRRNRRMLLQGCAISGKEETAVTVPGSEKVITSGADDAAGEGSIISSNSKIEIMDGINTAAVIETGIVDVVTGGGIETGGIIETDGMHTGGGIETGEIVEMGASVGGSPAAEAI